MFDFERTIISVDVIALCVGGWEGGGWGWGGGDVSVFDTELTDHFLKLCLRLTVTAGLTCIAFCPHVVNWAPESKLSINQTSDHSIDHSLSSLWIAQEASDVSELGRF